MAYADQGDLSIDSDFRARIAACAATQNVGDIQPTGWADQNQWHISAAPGFGDKYASAVAGGVDRPGRDAAVISDTDLLAAVQHRIADLND